MGQQLLKEWNKFLQAWSVRITFLLFVAGGILTAVGSEYTGYIAPFMGSRDWGTMGPLLFAVIVGGQVAGEYQNGRAAQAAAETGRSHDSCPVSAC